MTQASLRAAIGIVPQDTVLFNDTIHYNIRYGRPDATDEEVIEAARAAHIHDFIESLPDKYETRRRRARPEALRRREAARGDRAGDPQEPAHPDLRRGDLARSTRSPRRRSRPSSTASRAGRTTLVIAHRLSTVMDADQILVMDHGRIVERGTHRELLAAGGAYAQMWALQQQEEAAADGRGGGEPGGDGRVTPRPGPAPAAVKFLMTLSSFRPISFTLLAYPGPAPLDSRRFPAPGGKGSEPVSARFRRLLRRCEA